MKDFGEVFTDINFILRFVEFILCLIGAVLFHSGHVIIMGALHGWLWISFAFLIAYMFEYPDKATELVPLVVYTISFLCAGFLNLVVLSILPLATGIIMVIDTIFICRRESVLD